MDAKSLRCCYGKGGEFEVFKYELALGALIITVLLVVFMRFALYDWISQDIQKVVSETDDAVFVVECDDVSNSVNSGIDTDTLDDAENNTIKSAESRGESISNSTRPLSERKELLVSIPDKGMCLYAYAIDGKTEFNSGQLMFEVDIYLEIEDKETVLIEKDHVKARTGYRLYYGDFFDDGDYLIYVCCMTGNAWEWTESIKVFDGDEYIEIPIVESLDRVFFKYEVDNNDVITTVGEWNFSLPFSALPEMHRYGNEFEIENGSLVEYYHYGIPFDNSDVDYGLCFRAEYVLDERGICIKAISLMEGKEYYELY
jgi:hypothetical protein